MIAEVLGTHFYFPDSLNWSRRVTFASWKCEIFNDHRDCWLEPGVRAQSSFKDVSTHFEVIGDLCVDLIDLNASCLFLSVWRCFSKFIHIKQNSLSMIQSFYVSLANRKPHLAISSSMPVCCCWFCFRWNIIPGGCCCRLQSSLSYDFFAFICARKTISQQLTKSLSLKSRWTIN